VTKPGAGITADASDFIAVGRALRQAGDKGLRRELFKAVQRATKPAKAEIKKSALTTLPKSGGLNRWVADVSVVTKQAYSGQNVGVRIVASKAAKNKRVRSKQIGPMPKGRARTYKVRRSGTFGPVADLAAIERGRVWHPFWGRMPEPRSRGLQRVRPGFFTRPIEGAVADRMRKEITAALDTTARNLKP